MARMHDGNARLSSAAPLPRLRQRSHDDADGVEQFTSDGLSPSFEHTVRQHELPSRRWESNRDALRRRHAGKYIANCLRCQVRSASESDASPAVDADIAYPQAEFYSRREQPAASATRVRRRPTKPETRPHVASASRQTAPGDVSRGSGRQGGGEEELADARDTGDAFRLPPGMLGGVRERVVATGGPPPMVPPPPGGEGRAFPVAVHRSKSKVGHEPDIAPSCVLELSSWAPRLDTGHQSGISWPLKYMLQWPQGCI